MILEWLLPILATEKLCFDNHCTEEGIIKICLLNPPSEEGYIRSGRWTRKSRASQQWYPIWLAYCTALLEHEGHECLLLDASAEGLNNWETTKKIKDFQPELIIFYWGYDTHTSDFSYADYLEEKICKVILVGPWSYCLPNALSLTKNVQLMTHGEFEHTVLELTKSINYNEIKGLTWRDDLTGEITTNPPRPLCTSEDLDKIPFVTDVYKRYLNLKLYRQTSLRYPFVDLFSARSCPHRCSYCVWIRAMQHKAKGRYRVRSIPNVTEELWFIKSELPEVKQIFFQDDTLPEKRARELSCAIRDEGLKTVWGGYSRAELSYETLKLMKENGCRTLHIGYEVPIQRYLDTIHKDITVEKMWEFAQNIRKLGMWTSATFMIFPWMTKEEIKFTIEWCKKIKPKRMNFIQAQAYPNTPYEKTVKEFGERYKLMDFEEMKKWEQWGFKEFYLSPSFCWEILKHPREWRNVYTDAKGLMEFLQ